jgi:hypothetical protein
MSGCALMRPTSARSSSALMKIRLKAKAGRLRYLSTNRLSWSDTALFLLTNQRHLSGPCFSSQVPDVVRQTSFGSGTDDVVSQLVWMASTISRITNWHCGNRGWLLVRSRPVSTGERSACSLLPLRYVPQSDGRRVRRVGVDIFRQSFVEQRKTKISSLVTLGRAWILRGLRIPLTLIYDANPHELALHAGTLDPPDRFEPRYNYGAGQRLSWVCCGIDLPERHTEEKW